MKSVFCLNSFLAVLVCLFVLNTFAYAQKEVLADCESDSDCKSGNCVTLRSGDKKCSNCDQDDLDDYTSVVDNYCKDLDKGLLGYSDLEKEFGSKNEVSLQILHYRHKTCKDCYDARSKRENTCWNGGDDGHKKQMEELVKSMNYLERMISDKSSAKLAYSCEPATFDDIEEDMNENCKELDALFEKYGINNNQEGDCGEIEDLIDQCIDCREAWEYMISNCFKNGASDVRMKRLAEIQDMEKIAKETLAAKKSGNLCK